MAKDRGVKTRGAARPSQPAKAPAPTVSAPAPAPKKRVSPAQFVQEVRQETRKITWTSWRETWLLSVMVFIMVVVTSIFFLVVDGALGFLITQLLRLAN
jgi:preprotein translocase subunit SecE